MPVLALLKATIKSYSQILFSGSVWVGLILCLATFVVPWAAAHGLLCSASALVFSKLLHLEDEEFHSGGWGYNALLCGLGIGHNCSVLAATFVLTIACGVLCVLVSAALRASLGRLQLPMLSIPFILVFHVVLAVKTSAGLSALPSAESLAADGPTLLRGLGALFFLPRPEVGALVLLALAFHSRISALLAVCGFAVAYLFGTYVLLIPEDTIVLLVSYNAAFGAVALGGVFFVPSASSWLIAMLSSVVATLLCAGLLPVHARLGVPVLVVPFNATVLLFLLAMRLRNRDSHPKSVELPLATPEDNLEYLRARLLRFGWSQPVRMQLPLRGTWLCTQGVDGQHTHKQRWRHAWDFEVAGPDGNTFGGDGSRPEHYYCYRLPVLAAAAGTVVRVEQDIPDNLVGTMNLKQNWGNYVLVYHAPGLYSLLAHLCRGSVKVRVGQAVFPGEIVALCGTSGRSPRPHLHFHLQTNADLGSATIPCSFADAIKQQPERQRLFASLIPREKDLVRNIEPDEERASFLASFLPGMGGEWRFRIGNREERIVCEVDLYGQPLFRSVTYGTVLRYVMGDDVFTTYDLVGSHRSVLYLLRLGLPRLPLESCETLAFSDLLPGRLVRSFGIQIFHDFVAPWRAQDGVFLQLTAKRDGAFLQIKGIVPTGSGEPPNGNAGDDKDNDGSHEPDENEREEDSFLRTQVVLCRTVGILKIQVTMRGKTTCAERILPPEKRSET